MDYDNSTLLPDLAEFSNTSYLRHSAPWTIILVIAYVLIFIVGTIGNSTVILVMVCRPQMRSVTNLFIMNLAFADWLVSVFCVPGTLVSNLFTPWILGSFMCKAVAYVQGVSVCASAYSLAAISFDRCRAIYRPLTRPRGLSKSQAIITIILIWILALSIISPWLKIFNVINSELDGLTYCVETWENLDNGKIYFLLANLLCCYVLPLVFISISNLVIWCHVRNRKAPQDDSPNEVVKQIHRRTRHGVRKMLSIVTAAFIISWLPLYVIVTRIKFFQVGDQEINILEILMPFAQWLGSWNSCINPVLYAFLSTKFREMFKSLLPTWVKCACAGLKTSKANVIQPAIVTCKTTTCGRTVNRTVASGDKTFQQSLKRAKLGAGVLQNPLNLQLATPKNTHVASI